MADVLRLQSSGWRLARARLRRRARRVLLSTPRSGVPVRAWASARPLGPGASVAKDTYELTSLAQARECATPDVQRQDRPDHHSPSRGFGDAN